MRSNVATTPGWYGKLPALGDFASRRLEDDFVEPWDLWLAGALQAQRGALGEAWLDAYLQSPPWRFLLAPGVIAGAAAGVVFAGVLVASVDRVGRHFPLTLAASLPAVPKAAADIDALLAWLHRLEDTALDAVQSGWSIDDLEDALAHLTPPRGGAVTADDRLAAVRHALAAARAGGGGFVDIGAATSRADLAGVFAGALGAAPAAQPAVAGVPLGRVAVFIADAPGRPQLLLSVGLPRDEDFARMFGGDGGPGVDSLLAVAPTAMPAMPAAPATDLLAMFDSEATLPPGKLAGLVAAPVDDILALFAVPADGVAAGGAAGTEPDILDLFGGPAADTVPDKPT